MLPDLTTSATCGNGIVESGEACDVVSAGCVSCEVAPDWTCDQNGCVLTCGDGVISSSPSCSSPERDTACDMTGFWGARETEYERDSIVGSLQISSQWYFFHLTQTANDFVVDEALDCGVHVTGSATVEYSAASLRALIYANRMDDATGAHGARHGTSQAVTGGCAVTFDRWYSVRGAEDSFLPADFTTHPALSSLTPLPTESDPVNGTDSPAGITDPDGDGIPGVAFDVTGFVTGIRNSAQRVWQEYATASNSVAPASAINVVVPGAFDIEEHVMRVTDCGTGCTLLASAANAAQNIPGRMVFSFIGKTFGSPRVAAVAANIPRQDINDDLTTCANVRLLLPHDATVPAGTTP